MPNKQDYGHLSYEDSKHVYWPNNMQALIERHHIPRINGFPSTISEIEYAKTHYFKVREYYLDLERDFLMDVKDDKLFDKLVKN